MGHKSVFVLVVRSFIAELTYVLNNDSGECHSNQKPTIEYTLSCSRLRAQKCDRTKNLCIYSNSDEY